MTPELIGVIIAFIVGCTALVKAITDNIKMKNERAATKTERDADSQELHDKVLKHDFLIATLKDSQAIITAAINDLRDQTTALNVNIVKLELNIENLTSVVKDLKEHRGNQ